MELIPGVHAIDTLGVGRAFIYAEAGRLTLIDTGLPDSAEKVLAAIEAIGRKPEDVKQIVITHYHNDHAGSLAKVVERTGAQVLAHPLDAPVLRGDRPPAPAQTFTPLRQILAKFNRGAHGPEPVHVDREVADGDEIDLACGATIVHTPGHTPGSIAVYVPSRRLLFAGDAAGYLAGIRLPFGLFTEDKAAARASARKLAQLDFDVVCFGHGKPLTKDASVAYRKFAEKL